MPCSRSPARKPARRSRAVSKRRRAGQHGEAAVAEREQLARERSRARPVLGQPRLSSGSRRWLISATRPPEARKTSISRAKRCSSARSAKRLPARMTARARWPRSVAR